MSKCGSSTHSGEPRSNRCVCSTCVQRGMPCARSGKRRHEVTVVGRRSFYDRYATDRQTHMGIGILGLQKTGVKCSQVLHAVTMHSVAVVAAGPQVLNPAGTTSLRLAVQRQDIGQRPPRCCWQRMRVRWGQSDPDQQLR